MIILDTNVISEMMKPAPSQHVTAWMDQQASISLFITSVTIAEIVYGLHALPYGNRKLWLEQAFTNAVMEAFKNRILSFDQLAAFQYGKIMAQRKADGRPLSVCDGQIAAIASVHHFVIATRNVNDFIHCGVELVNPFEKK
jgi:predicted nucleic acid-binding protein